MWPVLAALCTTASGADAFTAWEGTRWLFEVEETTPVPVELNADTNGSFQTRAIQIRAVVSCPSATRIGAKKAELDCTIDDVALQATPRFAQPSRSLIDANQAVLADLDQTLTGSRLTLSLTADGRVAAVDLPDAQGGNRRQNQVRENLRRLTVDLISGLHLKRPPDWAEGWTEKNSGLLHAPAVGLGAAVSRTKHEVSVVDGRTIVQSKGDGTFTTPFVPQQFSYSGKVGSTTTSDTPTEGNNPLAGEIGPEGAGGPNTTLGGRRVDVSGQPDATTPTDFLFRGELTSVSVLDAEGRPTERVWAMLAGPSASSVGNMMGGSLWYAGHHRLLAADEAVDLGPTQMVSPPGSAWEGVPAWAPIETL